MRYVPEQRFLVRDQCLEALRHRVEGKAHRFFPRISRDDFTRRTVDTLVTRLFRGRPEALMSHLMGSETISEAELERIRELLEEGES